MFCTVLILCFFVLNLVSVYYLEVPVFVKILLFWNVCLSLLDMRCITHLRLLIRWPVYGVGLFHGVTHIYFFITHLCFNYLQAHSYFI
jgi:hypothetical protein